jgi:predicted nucleic acid-binding protein
MPPRSTIYWDACIFIAWLKNEVRPPGEMDGIVECVEAVERNEIRLITSVQTRTEVFEANLSDQVKTMYADLLKRRNVQLIDNDLRVSDLARQIREYYAELSHRDGQPGITTPDAVHLATAIHYKADAFYTFDKGDRKARSLLSLDGNVAGHPLKIWKGERRRALDNMSLTASCHSGHGSPPRYSGGSTPVGAATQLNVMRILVLEYSEFQNGGSNVFLE